MGGRDFVTLASKLRGVLTGVRNVWTSVGSMLTGVCASCALFAAGRDQAVPSSRPVETTMTDKSISIARPRYSHLRGDRREGQEEGIACMITI